MRLHVISVDRSKMSSEKSQLQNRYSNVSFVYILNRKQHSVLFIDTHYTETLKMHMGREHIIFKRLVIFG